MPKKQSFLDEPSHGNGKRHLRIVITESNERNEFLTIPVDTLRNRTQDTSCVIEPGEHDFIKTHSFANYYYAKVLNFAQVFNGIQRGLLIRKSDVSDELLKKIQEGAKNTLHLNSELKEWFDFF